MCVKDWSLVWEFTLLVREKCCAVQFLLQWRPIGRELYRQRFRCAHCILQRWHLARCPDRRHFWRKRCWLSGERISGPGCPFIRLSRFRSEAICKDSPLVSVTHYIALFLKSCLIIKGYWKFYFSLCQAYCIDFQNYMKNVYIFCDYHILENNF